MNVLLVSQCSGNALTETRRILDQFAERKGHRTWQTPITMEGLNTLRRLLRKKARKNTAVACHWIRGKDHSELIWIVGDASQFGVRGIVPTNFTRRDILRSNDENDWRNGEDICLLAAMAALLHDLGKASLAFQQKLIGKGPLERNLYRHEWLSLRLFQAFVGADDDATWLARLQEPTDKDNELWISRLYRDGLDSDIGNPFRGMPPLARAIGWLVLTHHRLPVMPSKDDSGEQRWLGSKVKGFRAEQLRDVLDKIGPDWNEVVQGKERTDIEPYWDVSKGLPVTTEKWKKRASSLAKRMLGRTGMQNKAWLDDNYVMHVARMSLMLADHHYSSLTDPALRVRGATGYSLYANTNRDTGLVNQPLDEHLLGVEQHVQAICRSLPSLASNLPRLARHKGFRKRSENPRFRWQDKAFDMAEGLRDRSRAQGFFGINMASTGCGKTLANGRIMYALADPDQGARFSIALGLRTLTLQTGKAYRELLNLGEDDLAIRVGGSASRTLFEHQQSQAARTGSESSQPLMDDDSYVHFEGNFEAHPVLRRTGHNPYVNSLIAAPILTCTVDHLIPATESLRGGHQIAPMIRLMSSDLVLDEPDDFDLADLPALTRLVHWAGLLGSRVLLSSATLPPAMVEGLFEAYSDGRRHFQNNRGTPGQPVNICCAWFDENDRSHSECSDSQTFRETHQVFVDQRYKKLGLAAIRRRSQVVPLAIDGRDLKSLCPPFAAEIMVNAIALHQKNHSVDPITNKRVSFGLVRMANIEPLVEVALTLFRSAPPEGCRIHLCVYHSQHPLLIRSSIERQLDEVLDRRQADRVFQHTDIRGRLDNSKEPDHLFIVLGSPVTEVGRDHDYDWALVEPSSMRSLIQLAGRVRRHRLVEWAETNILIFDVNMKHLRNPAEPAFCRPGFEGKDPWLLHSHHMEKLLTDDELSAIDARPRITQRQPLAPNDSLVDLEHARLADCMLKPPEPVQANTMPMEKPLTRRQRMNAATPAPLPPLRAHSWWSLRYGTLTGACLQQQPFRENTIQQTELVLMPEESGEDYQLHAVDKAGSGKADLLIPVETKNQRIPDSELCNARVGPWGEPDYMEALVSLADELGMELEACARKFGTVTLGESEQGWRYHPVLGFSKQR
ncbi:type I-F CRISPR-associated helicase Cas3f [uncultured Marinobacter sp.]|uniref:type I-F CRISPR-associated helicase Cas3f n=1 Tax=uncultured Marinobacter sp. TaxID=187379 RepID=UPI0030D89AF3